MAVIILAAIVFFTRKGRRPIDDDRVTRLAPDSTQVAPKNGRESGRNSRTRTPPKKWPVGDAGDIAALLKHHRPRLAFCKDTVHADNRPLVVHYSIDTMMQNRGRILLERYHPKYGAIVMMESETGRVLSLVSYCNEDEPFLGKDLYCRSYFPAASVFKIVAAAGAIERGGLTGSSRLKQVGRNHTLYKNQLEKELKNFREISLSEAFAYSINPVFGRLGIYVLGFEGLHAWAGKFGFMQPVPFELETDIAQVMVGDSDFHLAELASGFNRETRMSPLFGALIAAAVSESGRMPRPTLVDSVTEFHGGARLYAASRAPWRIAMRAATAGELKRLMMDVSRFGTARKSFRYVKQTAQFREIEYGGKTGSIDKDGVGRVDWFVGFSRHPRDARKRVSVAVVTVHGAYWTVHSSYCAAEMMRRYVRSLDIRGKERDDVEEDKMIERPVPIKRGETDYDG